MGYAFVDRKCHCEGTDCYCSDCHGTGIVGTFEEVPDTPIHIPMAIAYRLRQQRERRNVSMSDLAAHFGWSLVHLSDIERGRLDPTPEEIMQIREWLYGLGANQQPEKGGGKGNSRICARRALNIWAKTQGKQSS